MVNFTSICTSFTYQDMKKYDKIYQDKVLGEMDRTLVNTRKIEVIPKYAKKSKSVLRLPRQHLNILPEALIFQCFRGLKPIFTNDLPKLSDLKNDTK